MPAVSPLARPYSSGIATPLGARKLMHGDDSGTRYWTKGFARRRQLMAQAMEAEL